MKIDFNFMPQNIAPLGVNEALLYDSQGNLVTSIPLGKLTPPDVSKKLYRFGALSDVHLPYDTGKSDFVKALTYFQETESVNFICISGDMGSSGTDAEWSTYKTYIDTYSPNTPVYISAGNHDAGDSAAKSYNYPVAYTGNPLYYSFTQGNDVFIMFGLSLWGNPPFTAEALQWLYETLEENRNKRVFLFQHYLRLDGCGNANNSYPWDGLGNTNGKVFLTLTEHYKNVLWFHGHTHAEFEHQETLSVKNANYDRLHGCHSIHIPSCCATRTEDNGTDYNDSEGYVVDVYSTGVHLRGRDFVADKFLPIASYWIDTSLTNIEAETYIDPYGVINTPNQGGDVGYQEIDMLTGGELYINKRYSSSSVATATQNGRICVIVPVTVGVGTECTITINNAPTSLAKYKDFNQLYFLNEGQTTCTYLQDGSNGHFYYMKTGFTISSDELSATIVFTPPADTKYIVLNLTINNNVVITESNLSGLSVTLQVGKNS